jgi:hypothetical protein
MFMSIKKTVGIVVATLTTICGMAAATALPATGATPQCGASCIEIFSAKFGTPVSPTFVETVFHGVAAAGVPTILHRPSNRNPAADLIVPLKGPVPVSQFYAHGMVSGAVNSHYGSEPAVQVEYAPLGIPTGLCAALAATAYQNEGLSLQPCSVPDTTVWIIDIADSPAAAPTYFPLVNGSNRDFSRPYGMTILGNPGRERFPQIKVRHLVGNPGDVPADQLWGSVASTS